MNKPKKLSELQNLMFEAIQQRSAPMALANLILEKPPISIHQRLKIYQEAYQIRLLESLRDDFSRIEQTLGREAFDTLAHEYIRRHPSRYQNLAEYSEEFPDFIQTFHPDLTKLAITDWLEILSTQSKEPDDLLAAEVIQSGQSFKIKISPSTFVKEIQGSIIVVYREQDAVVINDIEKPLFNLLEFLESERNLEEITEYAQKNQLNEEIMVSILQEWIKKQIIYCKSNAVHFCHAFVLAPLSGPATYGK